MTTKTFRGELYSEDGRWLGNIHKHADGYVIRMPDGRTHGPVIFDGQVFKGSAFTHAKTLDLGYATVRQYRLA